LRAKAGEPSPRSGLWQSQDSKAQQRHFEQGEIMPDLRSAYGFTIWQYMGKD
jgi:hypothetical protein